MQTWVPARWFFNYLTPLTLLNPRSRVSKAMSDPALLADAQKRKWDMDPLSGEELEKTAKEIIVQPTEVISRMKKLLEN